ncbi:MAG: lysoplasmalogenase, partial [Bacteroidota bacterium]
FVPGLLAFLTAHIFYILFYVRTKSEKISFFKLRPVMLIAVLAYLIEFMYLLWPSLGGMKIPVLIYGITISTMLSAAIWQYQKLDDRTSLFLIIGAALFVTSDSILAINKFSSPFDSAGIFIMATYILAQLFIVLGAIRYRNNSE